MESMKDMDRVMEREIKKGRTPLKFEQLGFGDYSYNEITSKEKLLQVLSYLLRIGEYETFAGKTIGNNVYMDIRGKKVVFKRTRLTYERNNIFAMIKRLAKKYKPDYEGKVYLETVRCFFTISEEELEKCRYNYKCNTLLWRKAWADYTNDFLERNGSPERIDHRSNAERGIDEIPTVHMGVAACQMEKKGIATEKGELNRSIQKTNRLIREIRAQIGKLKEWIADLFKARETAPEQPPQSPNLANLLMKYLSVQREKSRKYSQRWQQQHTADELKTIAAAVNYLSEHGISNLDELDASLSSVSDKAYSIREGMKTAEQRMKELQKLMEYGRNYQTYKPIQDEYRQIRWKGKQEKFAEARRAELTLWDAANRYLHAHLPEGVKTLPISAWEKEYTALKAQREAEYDTLKDTRAEVAELQKIRRCVDIALRADQPEQMQSRTKRHEQER